MSTTAKQTWLKLLRGAGVKQFRATSALHLPYICHLGDESGETPFIHKKHSLPELAIMSAWCATIESPVIFDIGANNGFIATQLAQLLRKNSPRIYAVEPVPSTFHQLKRSVELLGLQEMVFPICSAVSDMAGISKVLYNPHKSLYAQVSNGQLPDWRLGTMSALVPTITIDQLVESLGVKPSLLKIDVEGFEPRALRGSAKLLASDNPPAISFEWNPLTLSEVNSSPSALTRCLPGHRFYYIDDFEGQRKPFGQEIPELTQITWVCNMFAVPNLNLQHWSKALAAAQRIGSI